MTSPFGSAGGINLNAAVSMILDPLHRIERIIVRKYQGHVTDAEGKRIAQYGEPFEMDAQIQDPRDSQLQHANRINENGIQRRFWVNGSIEPIDRLKGRGGDIILYDGYVWYVTSCPDNFNKQGWVSVIAEAIVREEGSVYDASGTERDISGVPPEIHQIF